MIKHIVMWKFKPATENEQERFLIGLENLYGVIPQLKSCIVKKNCNPNEDYDAVLIADFDSMDDLKKYSMDPRHIEVSSICKSIRENRTCVDYEY